MSMKFKFLTTRVSSTGTGAARTPAVKEAIRGTTAYLASIFREAQNSGNGSKKIATEGSKTLANVTCTRRDRKLLKELKKRAIPDRGKLGVEL